MNGSMIVKKSAPPTIDEIDEDIERILSIFLCNDINGALNEIEPKLDVHYFYHVIKAVFISLNGMITFDDHSLNQAIEVIAVSMKSVSVNRRKRPSIITSLWTSVNYDDWTNDEVYAELSHLILSAYNTLMILATEKTISGLVKAGYYAKSSMSTLKECDAIKDTRTRWSSPRTRLNFEHAVNLGHGLFGMVISMSPPRILKILSYFGYHFDREKSLKLLESIAFSDSVWSPISGLALLGYHLEIEFIAGLGHCDLELTHRLICINRKRFPGSGFFLMFEGIHEQISGNLDMAMELITKSRQTFTQWIEWQNACDWLLVWIYSIQRKWPEAEECIKSLKEKCSWSPCVFTYIHGAIKQMMVDELVIVMEACPSPDANVRLVNQVKMDQLRHEIDDLLQLAPKLKNSMAGKTIYFEKFVTKRCQILDKERKLDTEAQLCLPMLEQLFFWNILSMSSNSPQLLDSFVDMINDQIKIMKFDTDLINNQKTSFDAVNETPSIKRKNSSRRSSSRKSSKVSVSNLDDGDQDQDKIRNAKIIDERLLYLITMKGICLHYMSIKDIDAMTDANRQLEAKSCLKFVIDKSINLNLYQHLAPLASLELGIIYSASDDDNDLDMAMDYLLASTSNYKQYLNETMVNMRSASAINFIKDKREQKMGNNLKQFKRSQSENVNDGDADKIETVIRKDSLDSWHSVD